MSAGSSNLNSQGSFFFGWDLLYQTIEKIMSNKSDILIAFIHFVLVRHAKFRCIGLGEDKTLSPDDTGSELLPHAWNEDENKYALRYICNGQLYLLLAHKAGDSIIINLLDTHTKKVSNIALDPEELVKNTKGTLNQLLPTSSDIASRLIKELVEPVFSGNKREITTQTVLIGNSNNRNGTTRHSDPLRLSPPMAPRAPRPSFTPGSMSPMNPFTFPEVGRGDLDPLGRGGSGNLFSLPSPPSFNPDGRPRFDPYGVPDPENPPPPNPDHLRPPTFNGNNYYM